MCSRLLAVAAIATVFVLGGTAPAQADSAGVVLRQLTSEGKLKEAAILFAERAKDDPSDQEAKFAAGIVRFLQAVQELAATQYHYGLGSGLRQRINAPLFHEVLENPKPHKVRYQDLREMLVKLSKSLAEAEAMLAKVDATKDFKLEFRPGLVALDINGDGVASEEEAFWKLCAAAGAPVTAENADAFVIQADGGDVLWLRGYCHFLMAFADILVAHDERELFERCGHLLYADVDTPHTWIKTEPRPSDSFHFNNIADVVAFVHLMNFEVIDKERLFTAHRHLLEMVQLSRESWKLYEAETDDDHEWIPNPKQTSTVTGMRVTREIVTGWHDVLDEIEAILTGKKLVPFWRGDVEATRRTGRGLGVNLKKVFLEPTRFDVVMWVSGTGAQPFLEEGEVSGEEAWNRLTRVFQGEFFGFAIWFN